MKYFVCGRKCENDPIRQLSGPWPTKKIANDKAFAAKNIEHCLDVRVFGRASKPLRGGGRLDYRK